MTVEEKRGDEEQEQHNESKTDTDYHADDGRPVLFFGDTTVREQPGDACLSVGTARIATRALTARFLVEAGVEAPAAVGV